MFGPGDDDRPAERSPKVRHRAGRPLHRSIFGDAGDGLTAEDRAAVDAFTALHFPDPGVFRRYTAPRSRRVVPRPRARASRGSSVRIRGSRRGRALARASSRGPDPGDGSDDPDPAGSSSAPSAGGELAGPSLPRKPLEGRHDWRRYVAGRLDALRRVHRQDPLGDRGGDGRGGREVRAGVRRLCECGCGRTLEDRRVGARYFDGACRVRAHRARQAVIRAPGYGRAAVTLRRALSGRRTP